LHPLFSFASLRDSETITACPAKRNRTCQQPRCVGRLKERLHAVNWHQVKVWARIYSNLDPEQTPNLAFPNLVRLLKNGRIQYLVDGRRTDRTDGRRKYFHNPAP
jgi:hypothetical protein